MNFPFYIARRYLFSKKSHNAINVISLISVCGIAIATMALVCTLSVFNGFTKLVSDSFSIIDPDLQITPTKGKVFDPNTNAIQQIKALSEIELITESIEENALARNEDKQVPVMVRGVSPQFKEMIDVNNLLIDGTFELKEGDVQYCVAGIKIAMTLALRANSPFPLEIYSPRRDVKVNLANPSNAFSRVYVYPGGIFSLNQEKYDDQVIFISLELARELFHYDTDVSSLDIKLKKGVSVENVKNEIKQILGSDFIVKDRFEQQAESFRMINIEKWVTFLILTFILLIAAFNIVGSLSMLILDKENDIQILRKMGATNKIIVRIFLLEGWLISFVGTFIGICVGLTLCLLQQNLGILKLGGAPGAFIIDAYPVWVMPSDILSIFITVIVLSFFIVLYPTYNLNKKLKN